MTNHLIIIHPLTNECPHALVLNLFLEVAVYNKIMVRNVVKKTPKDKRKSSGPQKRSTPSSEVIYSSPKRPGSAAGEESVERSELTQDYSECSYSRLM